MSLTTRLSRGAAALCLSLTALGAQGAAAYSNMYVFGDSLSDSGNDLFLTKGVPSPLYYSDGSNTGRFTNGLNYVDRLAASFGLTLAPSATGGTNYAYGGARTDSIWPDLKALGGLDFNSQIDAYLKQIKESSKFKALEKQLKNFEDAAKSSAVGVWVDHNKGILYVVGAVLAVGAGVAGAAMDA